MRGIPVAITRSVLSWSLAALAATGAGAGGAAINDIDVDGVLLHVPTPSGFVAIPRSHSQLSGYFDQAFPPRVGYRRLVSFVPESVLPLDAARVASLSRVVHLQLSEESGPGPVTEEAFAQHAKRVEAAIASNNRASAAEESGAGAGSALGPGPRTTRARMDVVAYPFHEASPRHFAFSNLYRLAGTETSGRAYGSSTTIVHVLAAGKILVASVVGEPGDLAWTQTVCKQWVAALLSANPVSGSDVSAPVVAGAAVSTPGVQAPATATNNPATNSAAAPSLEGRRPRGELALPPVKVDAPGTPQKP